MAQRNETKQNHELNLNKNSSGNSFIQEDKNNIVKLTDKLCQINNNRAQTYIYLDYLSNILMDEQDRTVCALQAPHNSGVRADLNLGETNMGHSRIGGHFGF